MKFNIQLTEDEAQKVLNILVKEPYVEVVDVINKIQKQASEQRNKKPHNGS